MRLPTFTTIALGYFSVMVAAKVEPAAEDSDEWLQFKSQVRAMPVHKLGYRHLADDGVMRSFGPRHEVMAFARASPAVIARYLQDKFKSNELEHYQSVYKGVDGRDVADPWKIPRDMINPGADAHAISARDAVLSPGDIVTRSLQVVVPGYCEDAGAECRAHGDCMGGGPGANDCACDYTDMHHDPGHCYTI
ncbi:hypothetical protein F4778DRAFT_784165 [Xylariomycetidae sp. FL2044]|nr:hypothetical protein F4778DRAFT_784165 [Xylariomycetidae sp. FL2044]